MSDFKFYTKFFTKKINHKEDKSNLPHESLKNYVDFHDLKLQGDGFIVDPFITIFSNLLTIEIKEAV